MAANIHLPASELGVTVLQAGTPESLEAVTDNWLDAHLGTEVISMDLQVSTGVGGAMHLMIIYRRDRRVRR
ncbi:MAG: hypothetical protein ACKVT1_16545 [Dehalococcoidia bacterium]